MKKYLYLLTLLAFSCNPKEEIAPENPCNGLHETSAAFTIMETFQLADFKTGWDYYDTDTTINHIITFSALQQNADSFVWFIGSEIEPRRGKDALVTFYNMGNQTIKIKLIVYAKPNKLCFPFDNGIDTVERYLTFKQYPNFYGIWEGVRTDEPSVKYKMWIGVFNNSGVPSIGFFNLKNGCKSDTINVGKYSFGYKQLIFVNSTIYTDYCYSMKTGKLVVNKDSIFISYNQLKDTTGKNINEFVEKTFIGKRVK
jgi:hypothetical protein